MKKLLIIGGSVIILLALLVFVNSQANKSKLADSPYGDKQLRQSTIDQLDDENYQNIILPDELEKKIESGEPVNVYFFSPECEHCKEMTPRLMPIVKDMDAEIVQYNILEYEEGWNQYNIEGTPTLAHFEDGQEVDRIVGSQPDETIRAFFEKYPK
ncbi:thioredoxin family protein [Edaphobacillus lindanitolerans]|uniref:Thioredoxin n=1 Tax=Edaphobacillus lindanitolerans TaxID=550447 RepID=A0A1U7PQH4_9BACI|nr:thioredoxin family protein [Edaphobacillus lindanitolerans]SIT90731.1 Thioredoxin [Edaphobacillus lindanitolerans]